MASFVAVLVDPLTLTPQSLPILAGTTQRALHRVIREHPEMQLHGLFDKGTLELWQQQLDTLSAAAGDRWQRGRFATHGFIALMRTQEQEPVSLPLFATSMNAAVDLVHSVYPQQPLEGLFERTLLDRWAQEVGALEQAHAAAQAGS